MQRRLHGTLSLDSIVVSNVQNPPPVGSVDPHYTFSFDYSFYAALMLFDSSASHHMLRLIGTDETMSYMQQFTLPAQNITYRRQPVYDNRGRTVGDDWYRMPGR